MMKHRIKIERKWFDRIIDGQKTFEVRLNDRDYQVGDGIMFEIIDKDSEQLTLDDRDFEIGYIHCGFGMQEGYVVLGILEGGE